MTIRNLIFSKASKEHKTRLEVVSESSANSLLTGRLICSGMYRILFLRILAFLLPAGFLLPLTAQESAIQNKWSVETSLTFAPVAQIYMLKASYKFSENSELGFGPAFQNWKNTDKTPMGQANAYTLLLSYRYFFWKNFHVELELWPAYNHFNSFVDGKTYKGLELWVEYKLGYKVNLTSNLYLNLQPGLAHGLWMQNKWPEFKEDSTMEFMKTSLVFVPQILIGWTF